MPRYGPPQTLPSIIGHSSSSQFSPPNPNLHLHTIFDLSAVNSHRPPVDEQVELHVLTSQKGGAQPSRHSHVPLPVLHLPWSKQVLDRGFDATPHSTPGSNVGTGSGFPATTALTIGPSCAYSKGLSSSIPEPSSPTSIRLKAVDAGTSTTIEPPAMNRLFPTWQGPEKGTVGAFGLAQKNSQIE